MVDLRTIRKAKGLTQENLGELTGLKQSVISDLERGLHLPRKSTQLKIASILGHEIDWLSTYSGDRNHISYVLRELINVKEPGVAARTKFCRRYLHALEKLTNI